MYNLEKFFQNNWWNSKIEIATAYWYGAQSRKTHVIQNDVICCGSDRAPNDTKRDDETVNRTTIKEIWEKYIVIDKLFPNKKYLCTWCLKRIFGLNTSEKDKSIWGFNAVKNYIREIAKL